MENRPVAAYTLAVIGVALQVVASFFIVYMVAFFTAIRTRWENVGPEHMGPWGLGRWITGYPYTYHPVWGFVWVISAFVIIGLGVYGAVLMNSTDIGKVRMGSTLVLIASIIAFPTMWGFLIGSLLMFIGSLLGLTWLPPTSLTAPTQQ